jgi:uncharacterized protein (DUF2141 family)
MKYCILLILSSIFFTTCALSGDLFVRVDRFTDKAGTAPINFFLCDSEDKHKRKNGGYRRIDSEIVEVSESYIKYRIIERINPGEYSLSAYYDRNHSGKLERSGFLGIPKEPIGFSIINIERMWSMPKWNEVKFQFNGDEIEIKIHLISKFGLF